MNKEEEIKKFLEDLNKSEEGKKMLQQINYSPVNDPIIQVKDDSPKKKNIKIKEKKWWGKHFSKDKIKKSNRVGVIYLRNNGNVDLLEIQTNNGSFSIDGKPFHENRHCVYTLTKDRIPLMIVREWDLIPLGTKKWDDEPMLEKFAELEQHVLKGIRQAELVKVGGGGIETKLTPKQMILWGLVILVGGIILTNYIWVRRKWKIERIT